MQHIRHKCNQCCVWAILVAYVKKERDVIVASLIQIITITLTTTIIIIITSNNMFNKKKK